MPGKHVAFWAELMERRRPPVAGAGYSANVPVPVTAYAGPVPPTRVHGSLHIVLLGFIIAIILGLFTTDEMHGFPERAWSPQRIAYALSCKIVCS